MPGVPATLEAGGSGGVSWAGGPRAKLQLLFSMTTNDSHQGEKSVQPGFKCQRTHSNYLWPLASPLMALNLLLPLKKPEQPREAAMRISTERRKSLTVHSTGQLVATCRVVSTPGRPSDLEKS